jgi:hypothetical protein
MHVETFEMDWTLRKPNESRMMQARMPVVHCRRQGL